MNKVYVLPPGEDWIVDRFCDEWVNDNRDIAATSPDVADVIWLYADWCWQRIPVKLLEHKKVVTSIHHIVPKKFGDAQRYEFEARDRYTDCYHVPNVHTETFVKGLTNKPVHLIPYWANDKIWKHTGEKHELRKKHNIPPLHPGTLLIGSFQRDTEAAGIDRGVYMPKLEKGPDLFADYVERLQCAGKKCHVLLAGWRRQYLQTRLSNAKIPYSYIYLPSQDIVNELYQTLDMYVVSARYEGGPQALIECGLLNVPCVSRNVGMASAVLPERSIDDQLSIDTLPTVPAVDHLRLPQGYLPFRKLFQDL